MVKNPPANAGDVGLIPGQERSHVPWSNPACVPQLLSLRSATREATAMRSLCITAGEQPPLSATSEEPRQQGRHSTAKNETHDI